jgi:hypothetical protein
MRSVALIALLALLPANASASELKFDPAALCAWQHENNSMDIAECSKLEARVSRGEMRSFDRDNDALSN